MNELGKKIKEARIARKMTQSEVVGDFITRNMLSQIENGTATPSIKTLEYLSCVLDVPLFQLMPDHLDPEEDDISVLVKAKRLLSAGACDKVMDMEQNFPKRLRDEFSAIFSHACLSLAKQALEEADYRDAARFSQMAMEYAEIGIYANSTVKSESIMILNIAAEKLFTEIS